MNLHCDHTQKQSRRYLFVRAPFTDEFENISLSGCELVARR